MFSSYASALEFILSHSEDYPTAVAQFEWPRLSEFNWANDHFTPLAAQMGQAPALVWEGGSLSYQELEGWSNQIANYFVSLGMQAGDRLLVMLPNLSELWAVSLAAIKLGAVLIPATTLLTAQDLQDRFERGQARFAVVEAGEVGKFVGTQGITRISVGQAEGWENLEAARSFPSSFKAIRSTKADDPMLLYFTSGTTSRPKLVLHTHTSYPVGHLSTLYWLGLRRGDVHWNISSPGWAKHAWSSFFVPLSVGATVFISNERFEARRTLELVVKHHITSLCAPPTVWRMLIQQDLRVYPVKLRQALGAGEPLNPEVIEQVRQAWGLLIRDGYGQTETTALVGNSPDQPVKAGSMGRPLPGYKVVLLDLEGKEAEEGEISLALNPRPVGLMVGYEGDPQKTQAALGGNHYRTGDVARRDGEGYFWYVGRADDVFKSSDYRISPFELESFLIEHPAIAEAAVVPSPHPERLSVPKAYVVLAGGYEPSRELALEILRYAKENLAPYKRVRRVEFAELPKTVSGKIRRVELRALAQKGRSEREFWDEDFEELG